MSVGKSSSKSPLTSLRQGAPPVSVRPSPPAGSAFRLFRVSVYPSRRPSPSLPTVSIVSDTQRLHVSVSCWWHQGPATAPPSHRPGPPEPGPTRPCPAAGPPLQKSISVVASAVAPTTPADRAAVQGESPRPLFNPDEPWPGRAELMVEPRQLTDGLARRRFPVSEGNLLEPTQ